MRNLCTCIKLETHLMHFGDKLAQNGVCRSGNFTDWTVLSQEEPHNEPYIIGKMWKPNFWRILRFMILSLLEKVTQVLAT
ncbi:hypothetical protein ACE6H2_016084 [Prunus campanulata]